ncbi:MAG TPA: hypothetical protein VNV66_19280 [Pilimelia sp.]|nr:hypothetical protein [Pilimelia sp.]
MRSRLSTGLVAAVMAVTIGVGGTARPARAAIPWTQVIIAVASSLYAGNGGSGDIERAKREIIDAINASRQEILNHIDAIAGANVRACTDAATTNVAQIDRMDEFTLAVFALAAVDCATLATAYFDSVQDPAAADNIGKLMGPIYSIAMVGYAKLGFPTVDLLDRLIRGYEAIVVKLKPACETHRFKEQGGRVEEFYTCTAYNGDKGVASVIRPAQLTPEDRARADAAATRNTSRGVAQKALPVLRQLRATAR